MSVVVRGHNKNSNNLLKCKFEDALNLKGKEMDKSYFCFVEKPMVGQLIIGFVEN